MRKFFVIILCGILLTGCTSKGNNQTEFIQYLDIGYTKKVKAYNYEPLLFGFLVKRKTTCIYGETPNATIKKTIDNLYKLITTELNELELPKYVNSLSMCPDNTSIFVFIHSTLEQPNKYLRSEFQKAYQFLGISINKKHKAHWVFNGAGSAHIIEASNGKMFVEINQLTHLIKQDNIYKKVAKSIALEELYHAITNGNDIHFSKKMMSKLNEPSLKRNASIIKQKEPVRFNTDTIGENQFKTYFKSYILDLKPQALCSFDLWFLLSANEMKNKKTVRYTNYVKLLNSDEYTKILQRAMLIEKNIKYSSLFDPRCSGKNAGVNTKIIAR